VFYAIYEFVVESDKEDIFIKTWYELTLDIRNNSGGLGSRLHKALNKKNCWVAYAQWPNKETWEKYAPLNATSQAILTRSMKIICTDIRTIYQLEVIEDLTITES
jgi:quinol monooxygenase YgiN